MPGPQANARILCGSEWHGLTARGKTNVSYQGIALAMPEVSPNQTPLQGLGREVRLFPQPVKPSLPKPFIGSVLFLRLRIDLRSPDRVSGAGNDFVFFDAAHYVNNSLVDLR